MMMEIAIVHILKLLLVLVRMYALDLPAKAREAVGLSCDDSDSFMNDYAKDIELRSKFNKSDIPGAYLN